MRDVSTCACEPILLGAEREGIPHKDLLLGLPLDLDTLRDRRAWIEWDAFVGLVERFEELSCEIDGVEIAGALWVHGPSVHAQRDRIRAFGSVRELFENGGQLHAATYDTKFWRRFEALVDGRYEIAYRFPERLRGSTAVFQLYAGMLRATPKLLRRPDAKVEAQITPHSGVYWVTPPRDAWLSRVRGRLGALRA